MHRCCSVCSPLYTRLVAVGDRQRAIDTHRRECHDSPSFIRSGDHLMLRTVDTGSRSRTALAAMLVLVGGLALAAAQDRAEPPKNPFQPNPAILQEGMAAFRANCAYCH